jgi:hypothetical protein
MGESEYSLPDRNSSDAWWMSLPFKLSDVVVVESVRPIGLRFRKYSFNIAGKIDGQNILVTGEANTKDLAITKAVAEFIERCVLIEFSKKHHDVKTSNGWAAHTNSESAQENAIRELVERDAVLRHWYTRTPFHVLNLNSLPEHIQQWVKTELSRSEFPELKILISHLGYGPSVSAVLMNKNGYGVTGHCSKESIIDSIEGAIEESCRMAHHYLLKTYLCDTEKMKSGENTKVETGSHGVYYAHQEPFPSWILGQSIDLKSGANCWSLKNKDLSRCKSAFILTMASSGTLFVYQAKNESVIELSWGLEKFDSLAIRLNGKIDKRLIYESNINLKPHIIP